MHAGVTVLVIAATAMLVAGCGAAHRAKVPDGLPLDVAEDRLDAVDLRHETVGGGALELEGDGFAVSVESFDGDPILVADLWTVCGQSPAPGQRGRTVVLQVAHDCEEDR